MKTLLVIVGQGCMGEYGWGSSDYTDPFGETWPALGYSYDTEWNYCNLDTGKYRTLRSGSDNGSLYLGGSYTLDNGIELTSKCSLSIS